MGPNFFKPSVPEANASSERLRTRLTRMCLWNMWHNATDAQTLPKYLKNISSKFDVWKNFCWLHAYCFQINLNSCRQIWGILQNGKLSIARWLLKLYSITPEFKSQIYCWKFSNWGKAGQIAEVTFPRHLIHSCQRRYIKEPSPRLVLVQIAEVILTSNLIHSRRQRHKICTE